jgi:dsDNA-binding SOS-regulon protein
MPLDPDQEQRLTGLLDSLFALLKAMAVATTDAQREALRPTWMSRMKEFRALTARNVISGVQGPPQE